MCAKLLETRAIDLHVGDGAVLWIGGVYGEKIDIHRLNICALSLRKHQLQSGEPLLISLESK